MSESFFSSQPSAGEIEERVKGYACWLELDLDSLGFNLEQVQRRVGVEVIPCLKGNAYGHGLVPLAAYLMKKGVKRVLVAKLWEALQLRDAGLDCGIINMDALFAPKQFETVVEQDITQVAFSRSTAEMLSQAALKLGKRAEVFVKVDTGLNRVGVRYDKAADLIQHVSSLRGLSIGGIFSTFSEDPNLDKLQLERMITLDNELRRRGIRVPLRSMASSHSILHVPGSYLDAVRPGMMLLGIYPDSEAREAVALKPVLSFKARLEQVKWVEEGESVTYGKRFVAPRRMKVGTVHAGYSDGFPRGLTQKGIVRVGDAVKPVLGTVSVNHHLVDLDGTEAKEGDTIELVSREGENSLTNLARIAGLSVYVFCVALSPLTPRIYYERGVPVALSEPRLTG
jgi:alanine racemase